MANTKASIRRTYYASQTQEVSIDWDGNNFLVIYGKHINGWFIAIPNWQYSTEAGCPSDTFYNTERLARVLDEKVAKAIAEALHEHWKSLIEVEEGGRECQESREQN